MDEDKLNALKKFVNDIEWHYMEEFIVDNFELSDKVSTIDTSKSSDVIIGDVVARQRINGLVEQMQQAFSALKNHEKKNERRKLR